MPTKKKALSFFMAFLMAVLNVQVPAYAGETESYSVSSTESYSVSGTEGYTLSSMQEETAAEKQRQEKQQQTESQPAKETEAKKDTSSQEAPSQDDSGQQVEEPSAEPIQLYAFYLPMLNGIEYEYDQNRLDSNLSSEGYAVIDYAAGEEVQLSVTTERKYVLRNPDDIRTIFFNPQEVVNEEKETADPTVQYTIEDGKQLLRFAMPATNLELYVEPLPNEEYTLKGRNSSETGESSSENQSESNGLQPGQESTEVSPAETEFTPEVAVPGAPEPEKQKTMPQVAIPGAPDTESSSETETSVQSETEVSSEEAAPEVSETESESEETASSENLQETGFAPQIAVPGASDAEQKSEETASETNKSEFAPQVAVPGSSEPESQPEETISDENRKETAFTPQVAIPGSAETEKPSDDSDSDSEESETAPELVFPGLPQTEFAPEVALPGLSEAESETEALNSYEPGFNPQTMLPGLGQTEFAPEIALPGLMESESISETAASETEETEFSPEIALPGMSETNSTPESTVPETLEPETQQETQSETQTETPALSPQPVLPVPDTESVPETTESTAVTETTVPETETAAVTETTAPETETFVQTETSVMTETSAPVTESSAQTEATATETTAATETSDSETESFTQTETSVMTETNAPETETSVQAETTVTETETAALPETQSSETETLSETEREAETGDLLPAEGTDTLSWGTENIHLQVSQKDKIPFTGGSTLRVFAPQISGQDVSDSYFSQISNSLAGIRALSNKNLVIFPFEVTVKDIYGNPVSGVKDYVIRFSDSSIASGIQDGSVQAVMAVYDVQDGIISGFRLLGSDFASFGISDGGWASAHFETDQTAFAAIFIRSEANEESETETELLMEETPNTDAGTIDDSHRITDVPSADLKNPDQILNDAVYRDGYPRQGDIITNAEEYVWIYDTTFDFRSYVPFGVPEEASVEYFDGEIDWSQTGTNSISYKVSLEDGYYWLIAVPMVTVEEKSGCTLRSDRYDSLMVSEQSSEYSGVVPDTIGATVDFGQITLVAGEGASLEEMTLGYDLTAYAVTVRDDGGYDNQVPGTYQVLFHVMSWTHPEFEFNVKAAVNVVEALSYGTGKAAVHVKPDYLLTDVTDSNGTVTRISSGIDYVSEVPVSSLVITTFKDAEIKPAVTAYVDGAETPKLIFSFNQNEDGSFAADIDETFDISGHSLLIVIDDSSDLASVTSGAKAGAARHGDFDLEMSEESSDGQSVNTIEGGASEQTKDFYWPGSFELEGDTVHNRNPDFWGYHAGRVTYSSSFIENLDKWLETYNVDIKGSVPVSTGLTCISGSSYAAWESGHTPSNLYATVHLKDANHNGAYDTINVNVRAEHGSPGYQTFGGAFTGYTEIKLGTLEITKTSASETFVTDIGRVKMNPTICIFDDASCTPEHLVKTIEFKAPSGDETTLTQSVLLAAGTYWVKETERGSKFALNNKVFGPYTIEDDQTTSMSLENKPFVCLDLKLTKVDSNDETLKLDGAVYQVDYFLDQKTNENTTPERTWYFETIDGMFKYDPSYLADDQKYPSDDLYLYDVKDGRERYGLSTGYVYVHEVEAPPGYDLDEEEYVCRLKATEDEETGLFLSANMKTDPILSKEDKTSRHIKIKKTESHNQTDILPEGATLEGAVYGVFTDKACTVQADEITTNAKGTGKSGELEIDTYYVKELQAPTGMTLDPNVYEVPMKEEDETLEYVVNSQDSLGQITIQKSTQDPLADGLTLAGAEYTVFRDQTHTDIADVITTDTGGYGCSKYLAIGTYYVQETKAPLGLGLDPTEYPVTMDPLKPEDVVYELESVEPPTSGGYLEVYKSVKGYTELPPGMTLAGAIFTVYEDSTKSVVAGTIETDETGWGMCGPLALRSYYVEETTPPPGMKVDGVPHNITLTEENISVPFSFTSEDEIEPGKIEVQKVDPVNGEPKAPSGMYSYEGAQYGIYGDEACTDLKETLTTDANGYAKSKQDYMPGTYWVKEISPPTCGLYEMDPNKYPAIVEAGVTAGTAARVISKEAEKPLGGIKIYKTLKGMTDSEVWEKVIESGKMTECTFEMTHENVAELGRTDGYRSFSLEADGTKTVTDLLPGKWTLHETHAPTGYKPIPDMEIVVTAGDITVKDYHLVDDYHYQRIRIVKKDAETGEIITMDDAVFRIEDEFGFDVELPIGGEKVKTFHTDNGTVLFDEPLIGGKYKLYEVEPPAGYELNPDPVEFTIDADDEDAGTLDVVMEDKKKPWNIKVKKVDADTGENGGAGYVFDIVAQEDIIDGSGSVIEEDGKKWTAGTVVDTVTTGEDGTATSRDLYIGKYYAVETSVPDKGLAKSADHYPFEITPEGIVIPDATEEGMVEVTVRDVPTKVLLHKTDSLDQRALEGIKFRIKPKDAPDSDDQIFVTDSNGNLAVGYLKKNTTYTIQEVETLPGYNLNTDVIEFTVDSDGYINGRTTFEVTVENKPNELQVSKKDITNSQELPGAKLQILDESGEVYEEWESTEEPHILYRIPAGNYTLHEEMPPGLYEQENDIPFTVTDSIEVQNQTMNDSPYREVIVEKKDMEGKEFIPGCTLTVTDADGNVIDTWETVTEPHSLGRLKAGTYTLTEDLSAEGYVTSESITFEVLKTTAEDFEPFTVTMKDDVTKIEISKKDMTTGEELPGATLTITDEEGNVVDEWVSDGTPHYREKLPAGKYTLTETAPPEYYQTAESVEFTVEDTGEIQKAEMFDIPYREVHISKKKLTGEDEIPGTSLEIRDENGNVVDSWVSTGEPHVVQLPAGRYTLVETKPAPGFVTSGNIEFEVFPRDSEGDMEVLNVEMRDDVTKVEFSKKDAATGEELPGATLTVTDENGNVLDEWVSGDTPHYMEELPPGKYTMTEKTAPDGYEVAESVEFEVKDDGEIVPVEMFDAPYREVQISKKDITNEEEIEGAHLKIEDEEGNVIDEWVSTGEPHGVPLPQGRYTLTETLPGEGYVTADPIEFEVLQRSEAGDFEVQHVEMFDDTTKLEVSKKDITNGEELPGARLTITDENGMIVDEWVSGESPHYVGGLAVGKYTLTEETAPDGYDTAESIEFEILDTGEVQQVEMFDTPFEKVEESDLYVTPTKLQVSKQDAATGKELPGATLRLEDLDGNVIEEWVSGSSPHYIEDLAVGTYILTEISAPDGYSVAESVQIVITDTNETQRAVMVDTPIGTTPETTPRPVPITGDDIRFGLMVLLIGATVILTAVGVGSLLKKRKSGQTKEETDGEDKRDHKEETDHEDKAE